MGTHVAILGCFCGLICLASSSFGQAPVPSVEQARLRTGNQGLRNDQGAESTHSAVQQTSLSAPNNLDIGVMLIMKKREAEQAFRFFADTSSFYTNNAALTKHDTHGDSYFTADIGLTYEHKLADSLSIEATVREAFYRYSEFTSLDFESLDAGLGLSYEAKKFWNIMFFGRYNFERFTQGDIGRDFFRNNTLTVGLQKTFAFGGSNYAYIGYSSIFGFTYPYDEQRDEHGIFMGLRYNFTRALSCELYYRVALFDYTGGRQDVNQTASASLSYNFTAWLKLIATASFSSDRSNRSALDYDALGTGGGLALQLRF
jgi:outer membrane scaffolding protein for murein synthesis (MipA/OmpV family)